MVAPGIHGYGAHTNLKLSDDYILLPAGGKDVQVVINAIQKEVQKPLEDIRILFGGFMYDACVESFVTNLCKIADLNGTPEEMTWTKKHEEYKITQRIGYGKRVQELTDRVNGCVFPLT